MSPYRSCTSLWLQFDEDSTDKHQLFLKEHSIRKQAPEHPRGRTLFVLNIPPYVKTDILQHLFTETCGNVESLTFTSLTGFKSAYIVFRKESNLDKALSLPQDHVFILNCSNHTCDTGLRKYCKQYNSSICNEKILQKKVEDYMQSYDENLIKCLAKEKAAEEEDEDGWVTISGKKKRGQFAPTRKESTIIRMQQKSEERKYKKQLLNFYSFQIREAKKQDLAELRKKFELDKKRLQELKLIRRFNPF
ncbi:ribosomal RNA-processing protein 7 homolog A [Prorops nasuta]|uniref:ribosomal RNA-processing protein 7 homolog A n=1 Tax=Prorops nasuta TaxID=863751 RepID=UPI0034CEC19C